MAVTNTAPSFQADIEQYIADETLPLAQRHLVLYGFGDKLDLPKGRGTNYTATRFQRLPLPYAPLAEGVPPNGEQISIQQVTGVAQQWGDMVKVTDVAELTIKHPVFEKAIELTALQVAETNERNTIVNLFAGTQVNYVNSRGSRLALQAGDVLDVNTVNRTNAQFKTLGVWEFDGENETDPKRSIRTGGPGAAGDRAPASMPAYVAAVHPLVAADLRNNSTIVLAWSYSDVYRLYNAEIGKWGNIRFCESNMLPSFLGVAAIATPTDAGSPAGSSFTSTDYYVIVTGQDTQNQYESYITQVSAAVSMTAGHNMTVVLPSTAGYTYNIYVGLTTSPTNLGLSPQGPATGSLTGQATQLAPGATITLTGLGVFQVPPAAPTTGITVYRTFVFGRGAFGIVTLDNVRYYYLKDADKSDPANQLRIISWKSFWGVIILNVNFFCGIESTSAYSPAFG